MRTSLPSSGKKRAVVHRHHLQRSQKMSRSSLVLYRTRRQTAMIAALEGHPALIHTSDRMADRAPLGGRAGLWERLTAWHCSVTTQTRTRGRPLARHRWMWLGTSETRDASVEAIRDVADESRRCSSAAARNIRHGGRSSTGDVSWLEARHAEGALASQPRLVSHAVSSGRPEILRLLLELGLDPDESGRGSRASSRPDLGEPLREGARAGRFAMAEILLEHGANPNTNVYAASSAPSLAYSRQDDAMIGLLERHGGKLTPMFVGATSVSSRGLRRCWRTMRQAARLED